MRVAVVGATGAVGSTMLELLRLRAFEADELVPFASERSAGRTLEHGAGEGLVVQALSEEAIEGFDLALFSAGSSTSAEWAPRFVAAGAIVIDNSSHWRMHDEVPLVVAEINPEALDEHGGIVANPNCSTMQMVLALAPIRARAGIERVVVSTYQSVSGTGQRAVARAHGAEPRGGAGRPGRARRRSTRTPSPSTCCPRWSTSRTATPTPPRSAR